MLHVVSLLLSARAVLGLTVAALARGLGAMATSDRRKSQLMMRYRVLFQLMTVGAVVGGIYYNAYKSYYKAPTPAADAAPEVDNRVFLQSASRFDLPPGEGQQDGSNAAPEAAGAKDKELR